MGLLSSRRNSSDMVSATEIAAYTFCAEAWRLQHGLGVEPANKASLAAGTHHHHRKALFERGAGFFLFVGRLLVALALLGLIAWLLLR